MKTLINFWKIFFVLFLVFFISSCDQITDPTDNTMIDKTSNQLLDKAHPTRPIVGDIVYVLSSQVNDTVYSYNGTGNVTHLGLCTVIDITTHHYVFDADYNMIGLTVDGDDWITAANGSKVHMTWFMDYFDPSTWTWKIIGGTERFDGATGSGTFTAEYTDTGDLAVKYTGTITY